MKIETVEQAIEVLQSAIPYSEQIKDYKFHATSIDFTWRSDRYQLSLGYASVSKKEDGMLIGNDASILMERLIKLELVKRVMLA